MQLARTLTLLLLFPLLAGADTPEQDEVRIEALIRAEKAGLAGVSAAPAAAAAPTAAPAIQPAPAVAPSPAPVTVAKAKPSPDPTPAPAAPVAAAAPGVPYASLKDYIGSRVRVVLKNGTEHYAQLEAVGSQQITLSVPSFEYTAQFSVPREQIARIDLR